MTKTRAVSRIVLKSDVDHQQDAEQRERRQGQQPPPRLLAGGVFAEELGEVLAVELDGLDLLLDRPGDLAEVGAGGDVAGDVDLPRGVLVGDHVGRRDHRHVGHVAEPDVGAGGGLDRQVAEGVGVVADLLDAPDEDVEDLLLVVELADLLAP